MDRLLQGGGLEGRLRRLRRTGPRSTASFPLDRARKLSVLVVVKLMANVRHPDPFLIFTHPIVATNVDHSPTKFTLPALAVRAEWRKWLTVDISNTSNTGHGCVAAVSRKLSVTGDGHIESQSLPGERQHHKHEVNANYPQRTNENNAREALWLVNGIPKAVGSRTSVGTTTALGCVAVRRVVLGAGKAGCLRDRLAPWTRCRAIIVMGDYQEPCDTKGGRVRGVDDAIDGVQVGERQALERRLRADVGE